MLQSLNGNQIFTLCIIFAPFAFGAVYVAFQQVTEAWRRASVTRSRAYLAAELVAKGVSPDEVVRVVNETLGEPAGAGQTQHASEVVVESDGKWREALLLEIEGDQAYVHLVGRKMDDNLWVPMNRVRFPAGWSSEQVTQAGTSDKRNGQMKPPAFADL